MGTFREELERKQRIGRLTRSEVTSKVLVQHENILMFEEPDYYNLYLDDDRETPSYFNIRVNTVEEGKMWLSNPKHLLKLRSISFDWDLGVGYEQGDKLLEYVRDETLAGRFPKVRLSVHTSSDKARYEIMFPLIREIIKYWEEKGEE